MKKSEIRKQEMTRRKALSLQEVNSLTEKLLHHFSALNFEEVKTVHFFLPIEEKNEPNTFMLIQWLKKHHPHIHIIVPKADFKTALMTHHLYAGGEVLEKSLFNIPEPAAGTEYSGNIDMVIVPLLAFDKRGYRVGYGKGFYDRFLQAHPAVKIGLSFFGYVDSIADIHVNDVRLDLCITPERIVYFNDHEAPVIPGNDPNV